MSKNVLLISPAILKARTGTHDNIDPKLLEPEIKLAQDMHLHPLLGTALFEKIQSMIISNDGVTGEYKKLLDDFIVDTMVNYILSQLPESLSYQFYNKGMIRKSGENTELPTMSDLLSISNLYKSRAEFYATRLTNHLSQYAVERYKEYLNPGNGVDAMHPDKKTYTCPLVLDDDYRYRC